VIRYLKKKLDLLKLAGENQILKKECKTLKAENEILKSALRMREESGKKRYLPTEKLEILKRYQEMVIKGQEIFLKTLLLYYGIGRSTLFFWQKQYQENGLSGLVNKPTAPKYSPHRTPLLIEKIVLKIYDASNKKGYRIKKGYKSISQQLTLLGGYFKRTPRTIKKVLIRHGRISGITKEPERYGQIIVEKANELWAIDITSFGPFYIFGLTDLYSRKCLGLKLALNQTSEVAIKLVKEAIADYGKPLSLLSDNGSQFIGRDLITDTEFGRFLESQKIKHRRTDLGSPWQNGIMERFFGSLKRELLYLLEDLQQEDTLTDYLLEYLIYYNRYRPHQGIGGLIPDELFYGKRFNSGPGKDFELIEKTFADGHLVAFELRKAA
jgi:transposase InsO family protein/transposase-like protein